MKIWHQHCKILKEPVVFLHIEKEIDIMIKKIQKNTMNTLILLFMALNISGCAYNVNDPLLYIPVPTLALIKQDIADNNADLSGSITVDDLLARVRESSAKTQLTPQNDNSKTGKPNA